MAVAWGARGVAAGLPEAPYRATVYGPVTGEIHGVWDIQEGRLIGSRAAGGSMVAGIWTLPDHFAALLSPNGMPNTQGILAVGGTVVGMGYRGDVGRVPGRRGVLLIWSDPHRPPVEVVSGATMIRPEDACGDQIVGYADPPQPEAARPFLYAQGKFIDLTPPKSTYAAVFATDGKHQFGGVDYRRDLSKPDPVTGGGERAVMWNGSPTGLVDLTPSPKDSAVIRAARGNLQVGDVNARAAMWHGTAASYVNMGPAGYDRSSVFATNGAASVGVVYVARPGSSDASHGVLWKDGMAYDLHGLLPTGYVSSSPMRIDERGNILGRASNGKQDVTVVWSPLAAVTQGEEKK